MKRRLIDGYKQSDGSPFWTYTASRFIAVMRLDGHPLDIVAASDMATAEDILAQFD